MKTLSKKYKIDLIRRLFAATILVTILDCTANADTPNDTATVEISDNRKFCENFEILNVTESASFSFDNFLRLKGFTYHSKDELIMIAGNHRYKFNPKIMTNTATSMSIKTENYERHLLEILPGNQISVASEWGTYINMIYKLASDKSSTETEPVYFATTNIMGFCFKPVSNNVIFTIGHYKYKVAFTLIQDQVDAYDPRTFVIAEAPGNEKNALIIYPLILEYAYQNEICFLNLVETEKLMKPNYFYYYLQRTKDPGSLRLMKREPEDVKTKELFPLARRPTPGFILNGMLYLFDVDLGCVYIITDWAEHGLKREFGKNPNDIILKRRNVPFESFFRCDEMNTDLFPLLYKDRCETTIDSDLTQIFAKDFKSSFGSDLSFSELSGIVAFTLVIVFGCAYITWIKIKQRTKPKKKNGNKMVDGVNTKPIIGIDKKFRAASKPQTTSQASKTQTTSQASKTQTTSQASKSPASSLAPTSTVSKAKNKK